jgi:hypothetical protein
VAIESATLPSPPLPPTQRFDVAGRADAKRSIKPPVITVTGKAFFDVGHSLKDQKSNRRSHLPGYAAWEIHPVMKIETLR